MLFLRTFWVKIYGDICMLEIDKINHFIFTGFFETLDFVVLAFPIYYIG